MNRNGLVLQRWPGGIVTAAGGTRTAIKLGRPWQKDLEVNPSTCSFCTKPQTVLAEYGDWLVLDNIHTPFPMHQLVIPRKCWEKEALRDLGGRMKIQEALEIVLNIVAKEKRPAMLHTIYSGPLAGQNVMHLHHHILDNAVPDFSSTDVSDQVSALASDPKYVIFQNADFRVSVGGLRAGQCFIVPTRLNSLAYTAIKLSEILTGIIKLYAEKFRSEQGLPPDYQIALRFRNGELAYGFYLPVLNNWGTTEFLGLMREQPVILPWPHEVTAAYLRGEIN